MVRVYKRKIGARRYKDYTEDTLAKAVADVENGILSIRDSAAKYGVSKSTIGRKLHHKHDGPVGHPTIFSPEEESAIVKHVTTVADWGFPMSLLELRLLGKLYLQRAGRTVACFPNNTPGKDWAARFVSRHSALLTRRVCQNIKVTRSQVSADVVNKYFDNLTSTLSGVPAENIANYDETNLSDNPGAVKCLFRRGTRYPERVMNSTKTSTSVMFTGTASGALLPTYVVYKAENMWQSWTEGGPAECRYNRSKSGWFDAVCFNDWFDTVIVPWARKTEGKKVIIGDNLSSHFTESVLKSCERLNIAFVCLPPNATHMMQPLDVAVYGPLKKTWRSVLTAWKETAGRSKASLPKDKFPGLLAELIQKLEPHVKQNLLSGFRACGIVPLDRQEVLKKLPGQSSEASTSATVSAAVIDMLGTLRYGEKEETVRRRRRKVDVEPGRSVSAHDYNETTGTSSTACTKTRDIEPDSSSDDDDQDGDSSDSSHESASDDSDEEEMIAETNENSTGASSDTQPVVVKKGDWVVAEYLSKKSVKYFVGQVMNIDDDELSIKFVRRSGNAGLFAWPPKEDTDFVDQAAVKQILQEPTCDRRGHLRFAENIEYDVV